MDLHAGDPADGTILSGVVFDASMKQDPHAFIPLLDEVDLSHFRVVVRTPLEKRRCHEPGQV
jgi:hypothetical protein